MSTFQVISTHNNLSKAIWDNVINTLQDTLLKKKVNFYPPKTLDTFYYFTTLLNFYLEHTPVKFYFVTTIIIIY